MDDIRSFFRPPLAPTLYICIPKGDTATYEQQGAPRDLDKLRDYVVQGELLTYYVIVSFDSLRKEVGNQGNKLSSSQLSRGLQEQVSNVYRRLRFQTKFRLGKDYLPQTAHSRVVAHPTELPVKSKPDELPKDRNDLNSGGNSDGLASDSEPDQVPSESAVNEDRSSLSSPYPPQMSESPASDVVRDDLSNEEPEIDELALSKVSNWKTSEPVVSLDPINAVTLENGDLLYKLTTKVNLAEKFIGSSITMVVEATLKDEPMDVEAILSRLSQKEFAPPSVVCYTMFTLVDPLKIGFTTSNSHDHFFITVTIENIFSESVQIGDVSLNYALTEISKRAPIEMEKLFNSEILDYGGSLPTTLLPLEKISFVIKVDMCPLATSFEVSSTRRHVFPALLLTWKTNATSTYLVSQFSVPFPAPQAEQLLVTFHIPSMPVPLYSLFDIHVSVANLATYPRSIAIELPLPDVASIPGLVRLNSCINPKPISLFDFLPSPGASPPVAQPGINSTISPVVDVQSPTNLPNRPFSGFNTDPALFSGIDTSPLVDLQTDFFESLLNSKQAGTSIICIEKLVHLGRAEPKGEICATIRCIAAQSGIFHLNGIKILDKHNREEVRNYKVDHPLEIMVTPISLQANSPTEEWSPTSVRNIFADQVAEGEVELNL